MYKQSSDQIVKSDRLLEDVRDTGPKLFVGKFYSNVYIYPVGKGGNEEVINYGNGSLIETEWLTNTFAIL